jgi:hypothetical protein
VILKDQARSWRRYRTTICSHAVFVLCFLFSSSVEELARGFARFCT